MQTLKQRAIAVAGAIALGGLALGAGSAAAADMPVQPGQQYGAQEYFGPGPAEPPYPYAPPPVYRYSAAPPVVYYNYAPPPVVVVPDVYYPRRYSAYGYKPYPRYYGAQAYAPHMGRDYRHERRHWRRDRD